MKSEFLMMNICVSKEDIFSFKKNMLFLLLHDGA